MDATLCSSTVKSFAVVKFLKTNTVDAVPTNWLERTEKTLLCYWPQKNVTAKVKRRETPDKTRWVKCKVNVLTYTDTYSKAREKVNQATITSNLESDQEEQTGRNIVIPARYLDSDTDIDEPSAKKIKKNPATSATVDHIQQMPTMPSFTPSMDLFSARHHQDSASLPTHLDVTSIRTVPHSSGNDPSNISGLNTTPGTPTLAKNVSITSTGTMLQSSGKGSSITCTPNTTPSTQNDSCTPPYVRAIFMRLDKIEMSLTTIKSILTKRITSDDPELEPITKPLQTTEQLEEASDKLKETSHRKKVVKYLSLLGGKCPGDSVRRIMKKLGTNALWAQYSLKGRKGKRNFQNLALYSTIIEACHKIHPTTLQKTVENCIADTLRYAPHRGTRVNNEGQSMRHNNDAPEESAICRDHEDVSEESAMFEPAASD